jgi:hypothetical protein
VQQTATVYPEILVKLEDSNSFLTRVHSDKSSALTSIHKASLNIKEARNSQPISMSEGIGLNTGKPRYDSLHSVEDEAPNSNLGLLS